MDKTLTIQLQQTKAASATVSLASGKVRNAILFALEKELLRRAPHIRKANQKDLRNFTGSEAMTQRLRLDAKKISSIASGIHSVAMLPDPLGRVIKTLKPKNGLIIEQISRPIGVIGVIYESRPEVTIDLAALAIKSGNGLVLKGGKEAFHTNKELVSAIQKTLTTFKLPKNTICLINPASNWKEELLNAHGLIDVLIPRGGSNLIRFVREYAHIPVIETGAGVCHTFVDKNYDAQTAAKIIVQSKIQRPSACNSLDTLVIHSASSKKILAAIAGELAAHQVTLLADTNSYNILKSIYPTQLLKHATKASFGIEFLSMTMSIKTVSSFAEGFAFVKTHSSGHSEAILTKDKKNAAAFLNEIDAAVILHNTSTRFTDGGEFGMGAEVGISTQKLHARGPMGVEALTSYSWIVHGNGQVRT